MLVYDGMDLDVLEGLTDLERQVASHPTFCKLRTGRKPLPNLGAIIFGANLEEQGYDHYILKYKGGEPEAPSTFGKWHNDHAQDIRSFGILIRKVLRTIHETQPRILEPGFQMERFRPESRIVQWSPEHITRWRLFRLVDDLRTWATGFKPKVFLWEEEWDHYAHSRKEKEREASLELLRVGTAQVVLIVASRLVETERVELHRGLEKRLIKEGLVSDSRDHRSLERHLPRLLDAEKHDQTSKVIALVDVGSKTVIRSWVPPQYQRLVRVMEFAIPRKTFAGRQHEWNHICLQSIVYTFEAATAEEVADVLVGVKVSIEVAWGVSCYRPKGLAKHPPAVLLVPDDPHPYHDMYHYAQFVSQSLPPPSVGRYYTTD